MFALGKARFMHLDQSLKCEYKVLNSGYLKKNNIKSIFLWVD